MSRPSWPWIVWVVGVTIVLAVLLNVVGEMNRERVSGKTPIGYPPDCAVWLDEAEKWAKSNYPQMSIAYSILAIAHGCAK